MPGRPAPGGSARVSPCLASLAMHTASPRARPYRRSAVCEKRRLFRRRRLYNAGARPATGRSALSSELSRVTPTTRPPCTNWCCCSLLCWHFWQVLRHSPCHSHSHNHILSRSTSSPTPTTPALLTATHTTSEHGIGLYTGHNATYTTCFKEIY